MDQIRGYCNFSKLFDQAFNPEDINCDGCTVEAGYTFIFARECPIRIKEIGK